MDKLVPLDKHGKDHTSEFLDALADVTGASGRRLEHSDRMQKAHNIKRVVSAYMERPYKTKKSIDHNSMVKSDLPELITAPTSFRNVSNYDMAWSQSYREVTIEPGRNFWEVLDLTNGITFRKVPEGGRLQLEGISGTKSVVFVDKYGAAVGWTDEMIRFRQINIMEQIAMAFRESFWKDKADRHYALLAGGISGTNTTAWVAGSSTLERDIDTLNAGALALATALKDAYVGDPLSQEILCYAHPTLWARLMRALRQTGQDVPGQPNRILYNIRYIPTFNTYLNSTTGASTATTAVLVFPGYKNQMGTVVEPTPYYDEDNLTLTYNQAYWSYYGAVVAAGQIQALQFA